MQRTKKSDDDWVARILEIRASDEDHVYARVYWMYWPDELPHGTHDGKEMVQGRQPYHGRDELIASNHSKWPWGRGTAGARINTDIGAVDIIDVRAVSSRAQVNQWNEQKDDRDIHRELYWRKAFDVKSYELSVRSRL